MRSKDTRFVLTKDDRLYRLVREYKTKCVCMDGEIQIDVPTDDVAKVYDDFSQMRDELKEKYKERKTTV